MPPMADPPSLVPLTAHSQRASKATSEASFGTAQDLEEIGTAQLFGPVVDPDMEMAGEYMEGGDDPASADYASQADVEPSAEFEVVNTQRPGAPRGCSDIGAA